MSKHETPMTRWYWQQVGGTLIEEFVAVERTSQCGRRVLDGLVVLDGEFRIAPQTEVSLASKDVIVIQTKASRLGMYLMGQAFFSAQLIQQFHPRSVVSVALCSQDDAVLRPLFEQYPNMKVVVCPRSKMAEPPTAGAIRFPEMMASHKLSGRGSEDQMALILDNFNSVQVECLPPRCRADSISPAVATDQHSAQRG